LSVETRTHRRSYFCSLWVGRGNNIFIAYIIRYIVLSIYDLYRDNFTFTLYSQFIGLGAKSVVLNLLLW
jgi:hypothetical protein